MGTGGPDTAPIMNSKVPRYLDMHAHAYAQLLPK